jgi:hypothetical protein
MSEKRDRMAEPPFRGSTNGLRTIHSRRSITQEQLDHLPSEIHQLVARALIARGEWVLIGHTSSGDTRSVVA